MRHSPRSSENHMPPRDKTFTNPSKVEEFQNKFHTNFEIYISTSCFASCTLIRITLYDTWLLPGHSTYHLQYTRVPSKYLHFIPSIKSTLGWHWVGSQQVYMVYFSVLYPWLTIPRLTGTETVANWPDNWYPAFITHTPGLHGVEHWVGTDYNRGCRTQQPAPPAPWVLLDIWWTEASTLCPVNVPPPKIWCFFLLRDTSAKWIKWDWKESRSVFI